MERISSIHSTKGTQPEIIPGNPHEGEHERKHSQVGAFFVKVFRRESTENSPRDKATTRSIETTVVKQVELSDPVPSSPRETHQPEPLVADSSVTRNPANDDTSTNSIDGVSSTTSRRSHAEIRLRKSAEALNQAIAKVSGSFRVPDAIGLQNVEEKVDDIPRTARSIEVAIDGFIDRRQRTISMDSRVLWKSCASNIFKAFYPYVKNCLSDISVSPLERNPNVRT